MSQTFGTNLSPRQTAVLARGTVIGLAAIGATLAYSFFSGGRLASWCREMIASQVVRIDTLSLGIGALAACSVVAALAVLTRETLRIASVRRTMRAAAMPLSGKVSAALATIRQRTAPVLTVRDRRPYAYTVGAFKPQVVLSSALVSAFSREELKVVLRHELRHAEAKHPLRALLWELACRAFFFLPMLGDLSAHFALARELDADRAAAQKPRDKRSLAAALLKASSPGISGVAAFAGFTAMEGRIRALQGDRLLPLQIDSGRAAATFAAVLMAAVFVGMPARADTPPASAERCREAITLQMDTLLAPLSRAFPSGPSSTETVLQSREIVP